MKACLAKAVSGKCEPTWTTAGSGVLTVSVEKGEAIVVF